MPLATRQPEAAPGEVATTDDPVAVLRPGGGATIGMPPPSGAFLPSDGAFPRDPVSASTRPLALDALRLLRRWHGVGDRPPRGSGAAFLAELETARDQLTPFHSRRSLAESFEREAVAQRLNARPS